MSTAAPPVLWHGRVFRKSPAGRYYQDRARRLHRLVYEDAYGPIPPGWHVHHKDHNPLNKDPGNLVALPANEHSALHGRRATVNPDQWAHGTVNTYSNRRCRCEPCRDAWRVASQARRARRALCAQTSPHLVPHGQSGYTNHHCRCGTCTAAEAAAAKRRQANRRVSPGTA